MSREATNDYPWPHNWLLILTASFAVVWIVHRAVVQSITLDEANTYLYWVAPDSPTHWSSESNNHVLNSTLMRLSVWLFGLSQLAVRIPALLGGVIYILAAYGFCTLLGPDLTLPWALLVCFVYNPFIMDYLVAARGYGLALGFFALAVYLLARMLVRLEEPNEREILKRAPAISACTALSFCANFSFAYANAFLLAAFFVWACLKQKKRSMIAWARLVLACTGPGFLIVFILAGSALTRFPRYQLFWGSHSLKQTWRGIHDASFADLNLYMVNPLLADFLSALRPCIFPLGAGLTLVYVVLLTKHLRNFHVRSHLLIAGSLSAVVVLTLLAHWLQFRLLKIPLPLERTSVFFVPLLTAVIGAVLSVAPSNLMERAARGVGITVLCLTGFFFIGALRDSYFREWRSCADLKAAFPVILDLCRRADIHEVSSDLGYPAVLNFYRILYQVKDLDEFPNLDKMPPGKPIYVLPEEHYADFIRTEGLEVVYHGATTGLVVAIKRPGPARSQDRAKENGPPSF